MNEFDLARRLRGARANRSVEVGVVVSVSPFVVRIGNGEYKAGPGGWRFYEPCFAFEKVEAKTTTYGASTIPLVKTKELKAEMKYKEGDLLAVQQMAGDTSFVILAKLQEVV